MSSRQVTKAQVRRIAKKKADQASDDVKGQILGTADQTDLDTLGEIQDMLLGTHDAQEGENPTLNVIAKTTKGTSGTPQIFSGHNKFDNNIQVTAGVQFEGNATTATSASKLTRDSSVDTTGFVKVTSDGTFTVNNIASGDVPDNTASTTGPAGSLETAASAITFKPQGSTKMTLTTAGDLGIGIEAPAAKLDVDGAAHISNVGLTSGANTARIGHKDTSTNTMAILQNASGRTFLQYADGQSLRIKENGTEHARFSSDGYLGIGTPSPIAPLHVDSEATISGSHERKFYHYLSTSFGTGSGSSLSGISVYTHGVVVAGDGFIALNDNTMSASDLRIKSNLQDLEDSTCLTQLNQLKPKRYEYKDVVHRGSNSVVGFIAQEVREVLPSAVKTMAQYIPSIYQLATVNGNVLEFTSSLELSAIRDGGKIKVYDIQNREHFMDVASASGSTITLADATQIETDWLHENQIFVYGIEVPDFHLLKKEMIIPIAVGAIQELDRIQIKQSQELVSLKKKISCFEENFQDPTFKAVHEQDISTLKEKNEQTSLEIQTAQDGNLKVHETLTAAQAELKTVQAAQQLLHQDHVDSLESEIAIIRRENEALMNENVTLRGANAAMLEKQTDLLEQQTTQSQNQTLLLQQQVTLMDQNASNEQRLLKMERTSNTLLLHQLRVVADRVAELEKKCAPSKNDAGDEGSG